MSVLQQSLFVRNTSMLICTPILHAHASVYVCWIDEIMIYIYICYVADAAAVSGWLAPKCNFAIYICCWFVYVFVVYNRYCMLITVDTLCARYTVDSKCIYSVQPMAIFIVNWTKWFKIKVFSSFKHTHTHTHIYIYIYIYIYIFSIVENVSGCHTQNTENTI